MLGAGCQGHGRHRSPCPSYPHPASFFFLRRFLFNIGIMRDVVITGVGIVSPIGVGRDDVWASIIERRSGVRLLPELAMPAWLSPFGGCVDGFDPKDLIEPRKSIKVMCREIQFGVAAAELAWQHAGLGNVKLDPGSRRRYARAAGIFCWELEELYGPIAAR